MKRPGYWDMKDFDGINLRPQVDFIPDDHMEINYNDPFLGDYEELAKAFQDLTPDGGLKKRVSGRLCRIFLEFSLEFYERKLRNS